MSAEHFQTTIKSFQRRAPFHAFFVEMLSGDRVRIDHPEALIISGGVAVFVTAEGAPVIFDHEGVSQIIATPADTAAA
jgi:hypothetical protein